MDDVPQTRKIGRSVFWDQATLRRAAEAVHAIMNTGDSILIAKACLMAAVRDEGDVLALLGQGRTPRFGRPGVRKVTEPAEQIEVTA